MLESGPRKIANDGSISRWNSKQLASRDVDGKRKTQWQKQSADKNKKRNFLASRKTRQCMKALALLTSTGRRQNLKPAMFCDLPERLSASLRSMHAAGVSDGPAEEKQTFCRAKDF